MASGQEVDPMWAVESTALPSPPENSPSLIAHRGFAGQYPENTVGAVRTAANDADWIEIDCRPTADGDIAVFHDHRLDRVTDRTGLVAETPSEVVFRTEVGKSGCTIPRLDRVLDAVPEDVGIVLDIKGRFDVASSGVENDENWDWLSVALETLSGFSHPTLVSTFWEHALATITAASDVPTAFVVGEDGDRGLAVANRYDCVAIHPAARLLTDPTQKSGTDLVSRAHDAGLSVNVWSPVTRYEAGVLAAAGVDGIISDYSDVLTPRALP
ncbi:MAG: glycerophosphodiester phosphodiesterase [Euryarchaeota archaeon]|nr:glycerophosphodiester phosphodiesterase [Euryarchaeota archaeon]